VSRFLASAPPLESKKFTLTSVDYDVHRSDDVRQSSDEDEPKSLYKNFPDRFSETERDIDDLLTWREGWDGHDAPKPNPASITHARSWAERLHRHVSAKLWIKPHVSADEDGDISFEWWKGRKKLTFYISPGEAEYVMVEKVDSSLKIEDGSIDTSKKLGTLWNWLIS
jgi:hypothetical protein